MNKVKNQKMIKLLAFRELKTSRRMNFVLILSVFLTCLMFTSIASIGGNLVLALQDQNMRLVGGDHMAGIKYALPADYEKVAADAKTRDVVYRIIVGVVANEELRDIQIEVNCAGNEDAAKACFSQPTTGRLPEKMDEIALSSIALVQLGLPRELGTKVPLTLDIDGRMIETEFTLCGLWEGDGLNMAQLGWVSREFADQYVPAPTERFHEQREAQRYGGYWQVDFNFSNSFDIEGKTDALLERILQGDDYTYDTGINWAYSMSSIRDNFELITGLLTVALLVFFAGYLIIYNIFQLNITANIQKYGLLKTIGVTPAQIQRLVRIQAGIYAVTGIPGGLLIGLITGKVLFRYIQPSLALSGNNKVGLTFKAFVLICLIAGLFSYATVAFSANKPAKIAGRVSPMEALRFNETKITSKKAKKIRKVSPLSIARSNMKRSRKKTVIVILSLTLSMVLFNTTATVFKGLDMDKMFRHLMVGDFEMMSDKNGGYRSIPKISREKIEIIRAMDGVKECDAVYYLDADVQLSGKSMERAQKLYDVHANAEKWEKVVESGDLQYSRELDKYLTLRNLVQGAPPYLEAGIVKADLYGVDEGLLEHLSVIKGSIDTEKFATGNYALVYTRMIFLEDDPLDDLCDVGEKLTVCVGDEKKEYEVMAICDIPYALSTKSYSDLYAHVIVPESEISNYSEDLNALNLMILAQEGKYDETETALRSFASSNGFAFKSKQDYVDDFKGMQQMLVVVGGALTIILAVIGILNFINAVVTSMIARKKEFVVMQAVGMTGRQMKEMLIWEGATYVFWTFLGSAGVGSAVAYVILKGLESESAFFTYHFTIAPLLICVPILLSMALLVPLLAFHWISRGNTVNVSQLE